jgi:CubicO group peptidase (beta-lactamase class C family)
MNPSTLHPLPAHPKEVSWPTKKWPRGNMGPKIDQTKLMQLVDHAFADDAPVDLLETHALLIIQSGTLVFERYWKDFTAQNTYRSWSMAKSITHALVGILVREGKLDIHAPAPVREWQSPEDPRRAVTLDQLLRMSSGLTFAEDYVDAEVSNVIEMLMGPGKGDVAGYAAALPLEHEPDTFWSYSSGTTNIVSRIVSDTLGSGKDGMIEFMNRELFEPLGITSADPWFDDKGTFIGSSYCFATAEDFARFGTLYLRDGVWDGRRILPEGWADYARTPTSQPADHEGLGYGAHFWLGIAGPKSFSANGYQGQFTVMEPELDLVVVRHGDTIGESESESLKAWISAVVDCFR